MLSWVVTFLVVALIAGILGFGGIAGASIEIAKMIFFIAVVLFLVSAVVGLVRGRTTSSRRNANGCRANWRAAASDRRVRQRLAMTTSRYSLGTTMVPSSARFNDAISARTSSARRRWLVSSSAAKAFSIGP